MCFDAGGEDCGPFVEVLVVADAEVGLAKEAGCEACAEYVVGPQCGQHYRWGGDSEGFRSLITHLPLVWKRASRRYRRAATRWRRPAMSRTAHISLGYIKPFPKFKFGSSDKAFGTPGAGGSFGFADPDTGIGFAYAMNRAGFHLYNDPRELALRQVLFHEIVGARSQT